MEIERYSEESTCGVTLEQNIGDVPCTFTIAKTKRDNETIHEGYCMFNAAKNSAYVWDCIKNNGKLEPDTSNAPSVLPPKVTDGDEKKKKPDCNKTYRCK